MAGTMTPVRHYREVVIISTGSEARIPRCES